ncbi:phosphonate transport system substrate-binding protein [Evansella caseinilytica]|uniref:Phosphonate transport system substrate-binding protein n=1 Tax=Evansella caseinilytica TaxID=1503961 RepID=A0A1H3RJB9_9BACI|nr:PhnD/SsuA/transferrin family substrate-binding protein [Evansella caseinilytica]SDZ25756.1 phosphonate transport system substrate-binding protein [Evansella caseinilytica]
MKKLFLLMVAFAFAVVLGACSESSSSAEKDSENADQDAVNEEENEEVNQEASDEKDTLTIVWYPNESGADLKDARDEIGKVIEDAAGKKVEHQTTTDYIIAIESIANGNADLAFMGAQGYIEAHDKNSNILPLVVPSGASGTLEDAVYYSWLSVKLGNEEEYKDGEDFSIDNIAGKKFSFVSNSSTSGFKVPSSGIIAHFSQMDEYNDLTEEDLLEGGVLFSEVLYGGSHQGSAVNLLTDKADVAAFCDSCVDNYIELAEGEVNRPGAVYEVKADAAEPFNTVPGEKFVAISVTPVLNAPFVVNTDNIGEATINALKEAFLSDDVAANEKIFVPEDSEVSGLFKKTADERFVDVDNAWFNPIRELSN